MKIKSKKTILREKDCEWKQKVKERDNYMDVMTNQSLKDNPKNCHAHHILDKKNFPELRFDIMNGLTLSYRNHKVSKLSPHMNALFFVDWLKTNRPEQYEYLMNFLRNKELHTISK